MVCQPTLSSFNEAAALLPRRSARTSRPARKPLGFNEAAALLPRRSRKG